LIGIDPGDEGSHLSFHLPLASDVFFVGIHRSGFHPFLHGLDIIEPGIHLASVQLNQSYPIKSGQSNQTSDTSCHMV
jgi:hypothetical protein